LALLESFTGFCLGFCGSGISVGVEGYLGVMPLCSHQALVHSSCLLCGHTAGEPEAAFSAYSCGACCLIAVLRLRKNSSIMAAKMSNASTAAPTPMPALGPGERPAVFMITIEVGDEVAAAVVGGLVLEGEAVGEVFRLVDVPVVGKSCWRYSTHIGCAHMVRGPVTVVVLGAVRSLGYTCMQIYTGHCQCWWL
jgi:hypothetical protein